MLNEKKIQEKDYPFEFSVIMAVYNVAPFLKEAVDSLIQQDIGFEKIQIILVNDGSTDGSDQLCDEYVTLYPHNFIVIHKENGGVSSARNEGLKCVSGRYISFMDPDDKLSLNTLSTVSEFFSQSTGGTNVVSIPLVFFEGKTGQHPLNHKFKKGTRVIDLYREPSLIQLSIASCFVRSEAMQGIKFDERLEFAEDAQVLQKLFMEKPTLGVVSDVTYHYRKRQEGELSAIQKSQNTYSWYLPCLNYFHQEIIKYALDMYDYIPKFTQYTLAYDLQWRIKQQHIPEGILTIEEIKQYKTILTDILRYIDDNVIIEQSALWNEHKYHMLLKKHQGNVSQIQLNNEIYFRFINTNFYYLSNCQLSIEFIKLTRSECIVEGYTVIYPFETLNFDIYMEVNGTLVKCQPRYRNSDVYSIDEPILRHHGFTGRISLDNVSNVYNVTFLINFNGRWIEKRNIYYKKYSPIGNEYQSSYYVCSGWKLTTNNAQLEIAPCDLFTHIKGEILFLKELWKKNKKGSRKAVFARCVAHILKLFKRKQIWLVSDKANRADDNGEAFFTYLQKIQDKRVSPYFLLEKDSPDYERINKIGKVIPYMSWKHKLIYLISDYTISAYSHDEINNPFFKYFESYRDLLQNCQYIFLQHGIIKDDLSANLNKFHKNIKMFVCSTVPEHASVVETQAYGYSSEDVVLTGLPRYDRLYHDEKNEIVIMPTWRRTLVGSYHAKESRWDLKPGFKSSDYYLFYNGLLNHEKLLNAATEYGYTINFVPHPVLFPYIKEFNVPESVKLWGTEVIYRDMFARNKLLITDFSSVAFDFSYLRKPVLYAHFDTNHYGEGYFDYEKDGFGEVEYNLEDTVNRIIEYMKDDCQLKEKYRHRIDNFFAFSDQNNCERVFHKIWELDERK